MARIGVLFAGAWAALISQPAHLAGKEPAVPFCEFHEVAKKWDGHVVSLKAEYDWGMHFGTLLPDGCKDEDRIYAGLTLDTENRVWSFLRKTYPNVNFVGGQVWGTFTGTVTLQKDGLPYFLVTDVQIDESKRMTFAKP